jgi:ATP-dependent RNA helicase SUPV3L1/SUV3
MIKEGFPLENFPLKVMLKAIPYIELFTDFILRYYEEEFEASKQLVSITDLTMPHEWFPEARKMTRTIHYHMGPTNSGKTRNAINRLLESRNGIYCAPLRLLAWEISETLSNFGVPCNLITGQEK